jgi:hypothetical protein
MLERVVVSSDSTQMRAQPHDHAIRLTSLFRERAANIRQLTEVLQITA